MKPHESLRFEDQPARYRAIFISDIHLGTRGCKADFLLDFLRWNESKHLYLVGDIIDGWQLKKGWYWPQLKRRYPRVRWFGALSSHELARVYGQAHVFVFPSKTDTFGLVMAEAMACGLPVAAFPVPGPLDVIGRSKAGVMSENLQQACLQCLAIPREFALQRAARFSWRTSAQQFLESLVPMRSLLSRKDLYEPAQYPALSGSGPA